MILSCNNFYFAQIIRDKHKLQIEAGPAAPALSGTKGDNQLLQWNELMRNELDNCTELIRLLEGGGLELFAHAEKPEDEDVYILGPDVIGALKTKIRLMRKYWCDIENFLTSPNT